MVDTNRSHPPEWWPLPDGEPIGEGRARELVRWLRTVAPVAVEAATARLQARSSGAEVRTYAVPARTLARQSLDVTMRGLSIGSVSRAASSGATDTIGIALQRDGRLAITVREPGNAAQRWIPITDP